MATVGDVSTSTAFFNFALAEIQRGIELNSLRNSSRRFNSAFDSISAKLNQLLATQVDSECLLSNKNEHTCLRLLWALLEMTRGLFNEAQVWFVYIFFISCQLAVCHQLLFLESTSQSAKVKYFAVLMLVQTCEHFIYTSEVLSQVEGPCIAFVMAAKEFLSLLRAASFINSADCKVNQNSSVGRAARVETLLPWDLTLNSLCHMSVPELCNNGLRECNSLMLHYKTATVLQRNHR
jgi:hypothetical protein